MNSQKLHLALALLLALLVVATNALPATSKDCHKLQDQHAEKVCEEYCQTFGQGNRSELGECGLKAICTCEKYKN